ncbi:CbaC protein [Halobacteria archaeon AArc-curdl1]|uniref:CbaC protein n=1 Tax=Natronosalvus hydrolyticus TaxID=2979988 RepID=A0AAP2Z830_9EURY|nr:CbaC protein [Halobacteria archaeon AArc-curdl1]
MRISRGALLVLLAFSIPILVELRTVLSFFNIELSLTATMLIGAVVLGLIVFWATFPERNQSNATA